MNSNVNCMSLPDYFGAPSNGEGEVIITTRAIDDYIEYFQYPKRNKEKLTVVLIRGAICNCNSKGKIIIKYTAPSLIESNCTMAILKGDEFLLQARSSTIPDLSSLNNALEGRGNCCYLPSGFYYYVEGAHHGRNVTFDWALRLGQGSLPSSATPTTVLRPSKGSLFTSKSKWDLCVPRTNIHPQINNYHKNISEGCITVKHNDDWLRIRSLFKDQNTDKLEYVGTYLIPGAELNAFVNGDLSESRPIRAGSIGVAVSKLQEKLKMIPSGYFCPVTAYTLVCSQKSHLGFATGIYDSCASM